MNKFTHKEIKPLSIAHKDKKKLKLTLLLIKVGILIYITCFAIYGMISFYNTHDFRSPIIFQNPVPIKKIKILSPLGSKKKITMVQTAYAAEKPQESQPESTQSIVNKIYTLESSNGRNDSCISKGQFNGYGYMQSTYYWNCYSSHQEVESLVTTWVNDKLSQGYSLPELLCTYNAGIKESDCPYYEHYLSL